MSALSLVARAGVVIGPSNDPGALAGALLAPAAGLTIDSVALIGAASQQGFFSGGLSAGIGIEAGVILTSGDALLAAGPNLNDSATGYAGTGGNAALDDLPGIGGQTLDQNVLSFQFRTTSGSLFFEYAFASEEYTEWVGSRFNDVFAFFIDGVNVALVPDTSLPVSVNSVNCGGLFAPPGGVNCALYNDNDPSNGTPPHAIQYDGFTDVFVASISGLDPSAMHTMQLAIADRGDAAFDSAVFLKAGSFTSEAPTPQGVPEPGSVALVGVALLGLVAALRPFAIHRA